VLAAKPWVEDPDAPARLAAEPAFRDWPLLVLVDDLEEATRSTELFLWTWFTRFDPGQDLHARRAHLEGFHPVLEAPLVADARLSPDYPEVLEVDAATRDLVDRRWNEYGLPLRA
jgi:hypothetical protein